MNSLTSFLKSAHFIDGNLEENYKNEYIKKNLKHYQYLLPLTGLLNFLFIIADYYNLGSSSPFAIITGLRLLVLAFSILISLRIEYFFSSRLLYFTTTIYDIIYLSSFLVISIVYQPFDFIIQYFGLIILLLGIFFIIPNQLQTKVSLSILFSISFFIISMLVHHAQQESEFIAAAIFTVLFVLLSSFSVYRNNRLKRMLFYEHIKYERLASIDSLTNIYNRRKFNEELEKQINLAQRYNNKISLILFDIDYFKQINDQYGHPVGDSVLFQISQITRGLIREVDFFARIGGEEFAIILPHTQLEEALTLAERIRKGFSAQPDERLKGVTCSFGIGEYCDETSSKFFAQIDDALYKAKRAGRNQVITTKHCS